MVVKAGFATKSLSTKSVSSKSAVSKSTSSKIPFIELNTRFSKSFENIHKTAISDITDEDLITYNEKNFYNISNHAIFKDGNYNLNDKQFINYLQQQFRIAEIKRRLINNRIHTCFYFFVTDIYNKKGNKIICKPGYTDKLFERHQQLQEKIKCKFYLLDVYFIPNKTTELEFHSKISILANIENIIYQAQSKEKDKIKTFRELYVFNSIIMDKYLKKISEVNSKENEKHWDAIIAESKIAIQNFKDDLKKIKSIEKELEEKDKELEEKNKELEEKDKEIEKWKKMCIELEKKVK